MKWEPKKSLCQPLCLGLSNQHEPLTCFFVYVKQIFSCCWNVDSHVSWTSPCCTLLHCHHFSHQLYRLHYSSNGDWHGEMKIISFSSSLLMLFLEMDGLSAPHNQDWFVTFVPRCKCLLLLQHYSHILCKLQKITLFWFRTWSCVQTIHRLKDGFFKRTAGKAPPVERHQQCTTAFI